VLVAEKPVGRQGAGRSFMGGKWRKTGWEGGGCGGEILARNFVEKEFSGGFSLHIIIN
jgi:hypothetical protein